jgi:hypothetical protein
MPRADAEELLSRHLAGEFDQVANEAIPIGARVCLFEGRFDSWRATVTGREKGDRFTVKLLGENVHLNKVSPYSVRPALGSDLRRQVLQSGGIADMAGSVAVKVASGPILDIPSLGPVPKNCFDEFWPLPITHGSGLRWSPGHILGRPVSTEGGNQL